MDDTVQTLGARMKSAMITGCICDVLLSTCNVANPKCTVQVCTVLCTACKLLSTCRNPWA